MTTMDAQLLPVRTLKPHPLNPRIDLGDISALTEDIQEAGVIQPLTVMPGSHGKETGQCGDCEQQIDRLWNGILNEHKTPQGSTCPGGSQTAGDEWFIIAGHRRRAAAQAAGLTHVPAVVRWDIKGKRDVVLTMLRENIHRRDLTALEELKGYEQLELEGMTPTRIARQTRQPKDHVDRRLALKNLPKASKTALRTGKLNLNDAYNLLGLPPEAEARALKSVGTKTFRQEIAREHLSLINEPTNEDIATKLRTDYLTTYTNGTTPTPNTPTTWKELLNALTRNLPQRTTKAWAKQLTTTPENIQNTPPTRAILALITTIETNTKHLYPLLHTLGYQQSPIEQQLTQTPPQPSPGSGAGEDDSADLMEATTSRNQS